MPSFFRHHLVFYSNRLFPRFADLEAAFQLLKSQAQETSQAVDRLRENADEVASIKTEVAEKLEGKSVLPFDSIWAWISLEYGSIATLAR
jgi:hypothetical protein